MTFSSLIAGTMPHHNKYSSRRGKPVQRMIQHHHAASSNAGVKRLVTPSETASCTYIILTDGTIWGQVPEEFRPWTSGGAIDESSVTIEVQNISGQINGNDSDPMSWRISDKALDAIVLLTADVGIRHGWGAVNEYTYQGHRQYNATACPGGYLWARMDTIRAAANAYLRGDVGIPAAGSESKPSLDSLGLGLNI